MNNKERKKLQNILREPLTRHRIFLNNKIKAAQRQENPQPFELEDLENFINEIPASDPFFEQEKLNVLEAVQKGRASKPVNIDTPVKQLVWGAALAYLSQAEEDAKGTGSSVGGREPEESDLWKQITESQKVQDELSYHVLHVEDILHGSETKFNWGKPGTGFTYNHKEKVINIDLMQALIVGVEHARAEVYREIGRAFLSSTYPKSMQDIYAEMQPLSEKQEKSQEGNDLALSQKEYAKLRILGAEWALREKMFSAVEDIVVNRFVSELPRQQDHSVSLNNASVTQGVVGIPKLSEEKNFGEEAVYNNLCEAVRLSFFQRNGLFSDTDAEWLKNGVDPSKVRKTGSAEESTGRSDFLDLCSMCAELESLQPELDTKLDKKLIDGCDKARKEVIEKIFGLYGEELIQGILKQTKRSLNREMEEARTTQPEEDSPGHPDGEKPGGETTGEAPDKGTPGSESTPTKGEQQGDDPGGDIPDEGKAEGTGGSQDDNNGAGEPEQIPDGEEENENEDKLGTNKESLTKVEGLADMPAVKKPSEKPEGENFPDDDVNTDADKSRFFGEDAKQSQEKKTGEAEKDDDNADGTPGEEIPNDSSDSKAREGGDIPYSMEDLSSPEGYKKCVEELSGQILDVRNAFNGVIQKIRRPMGDISRTEKTIFPEGSFPSLFNPRAHFDLMMKKNTGILLEKKDFERFRKKKDSIIPIPADIFILVDGSGSMGSADGDQSSPLQTALRLSVSLVEGAKGKELEGDNGENILKVHVCLWGTEDPPIIIRPGDNFVKIAGAMETARKRNGLKSGTDLSPAIRKVAETIRCVEGEDRALSGPTHILVISDGDINDPYPSKRSMVTFLNSMKGATVDVAIVPSVKSKDKRIKTLQIEGMVNSINADKKVRTAVRVFRVEDTETASRKSAEMLCKRIDDDDGSPPLLNVEKIKAASRALASMRL